MCVTKKSTKAVPPTIASTLMKKADFSLPMPISFGPSMATDSATSAPVEGSRKRRRSSTQSLEHDTDTEPSRNFSATSKKKSVSFVATGHTVVETVIPSSTMPSSRKSELWYSPGILEEFKESARDRCRLHRTADRLAASSPVLVASDEDSLSSSDEEDKITRENKLADTKEDENHKRGLEHRISVERQRNKYVAQRAVLECARRLRSSNPPAGSDAVEPGVHLALVSSKVTRWSREVALAAGQNDFLAAYPELKGMVKPGLSLGEINARTPFPMAFKPKAITSPKAASIPEAVIARPPTPPTPTSVVIPPEFSQPIPTKLLNLVVPSMCSTIQEEDSDDEARRRLSGKRRRVSV